MTQTNNIVLICDASHETFKHSLIMRGISKHVIDQKIWSSIEGIYCFKSNSDAKEITTSLKSHFNHFLCLEFLPGHVDGDLTDDQWTTWLVHVFRDDAEALGEFHKLDDAAQVIAKRAKALGVE